MVLGFGGFGSTSGTETPPVNPPQSSSPPPPMLSAASFYLVPQGPTPPLTFTTPSFRWNNNQQYFNFFPTYPGLNPVHPWGQPSNRVEALNFPLLRFGSGSGPSQPENLRTNPGLLLGSAPNHSENYFTENLRTNVAGLHLGSSSSETNRDENRNNPIPPLPRFGLETNRAEDLSIPILRFGSTPSVSDNLRSNQGFRFGSPSNQDENRSNQGFRFGSNLNRDENRSNQASNPIFVFGSSSNPDESRSKPVSALGSSSNQPEDLASLFLRLGTTLNREENRSSHVPPFGSFPNRDENIGFAPGLNRVGNNEDNSRAWADLMLEAARPVTQDGVEEPAEREQELELEKGKSSTENSGEGNDDSGSDSYNDGDSSDDGDDDTDSDSEGDEEGEEANAGALEGGGGGGGGGGEEETKEGGGDEAEEPLVKTWNLRPRKPAVTKSLNIGSTSRGRARAVKPRPRGLRPAPPRAGEKKPKLSLALTKEEIEADFLKMTGEKPPKKPNKRTKNVQKQLDVIFSLHLSIFLFMNLVVDFVFILLYSY